MWCFGIKNIAGFVLEKIFFEMKLFNSLWIVKLDQYHWHKTKIFSKLFKKVFLNAEAFILAWIKPVLCSLPSKSDLSPDQPDQLPSKKCHHSLFEQNHLKTIQWNDISFQIKHLEFISMNHFTGFSVIHLDV